MSTGGEYAWGESTSQHSVGKSRASTPKSDIGPGTRRKRGGEAARCGAALVHVRGLTSAPRLTSSAAPRGTSPAPASERAEAPDMGGAALGARGAASGGAGGPWHVMRRLLSSSGQQGTLTLVVIWLSMVCSSGLGLQRKKTETWREWSVEKRTGVCAPSRAIGGCAWHARARLHCRAGSKYVSDNARFRDALFCAFYPPRAKKDYGRESRGIPSSRVWGALVER